VEKLVPIKELTFEEKAVAKFKPRYLDDGMLDTPPLALSMVRREARRMGEVVEEMLESIPATVFKGDIDKVADIRDKDEQIDSLYGAINVYLTKVSRRDLLETTANEAMMLTTASTQIENIGDIIEIHMTHLATMCSQNNISFSEEDMESLNHYHDLVQKAFRSAMVAVEHDRKKAAQMVLDMEKDVVAGMDELIQNRQRQYLQEEHSPQEMAAFTLLTDIMENLKRIYEHSKRIGKLVLQQDTGTTLTTVS